MQSLAWVTTAGCPASLPWYTEAAGPHHHRELELTLGVGDRLHLGLLQGPTQLLRLVAGDPPAEDESLPGGQRQAGLALGRQAHRPHCRAEGDGLWQLYLKISQ